MKGREGEDSRGTPAIVPFCINAEQNLPAAQSVETPWLPMPPMAASATWPAPTASALHGVAPHQAAHAGQLQGSSPSTTHSTRAQVGMS